MKLSIKIYLTLIVIIFICAGWGWQGHFKINDNTSLSFQKNANQFLTWVDTLAEHSSDADDRKQWDPTESPKHYLNIDAYPNFLSQHRIPQTFDSVITIYGSWFVYDKGLLPWATITAYDSLVKCLKRGNIYKARLFASDLGHYVGDGHMPLHITQNYDGQSTGQNGIHSRYESKMISSFNSQILYSGDSVKYITNVNQYVFNYIYANYIYVDSVLAADTYAENYAGNHNSSAYTQALWSKSQYFTKLIFKKASHSLAELIYTAWVNAGTPNVSSTKNIDILSELCKIYPNPVCNFINIDLSLLNIDNISIKIYDITGNLLYNNTLNSSDKIKIDCSFLKNGVYILSVKSGSFNKNERIIKIDN